MFFSVVTKNSSWELLTKNLILKDKIGLRTRNFNILWVHWKILFLEGGVTRNQYRGGLPKGGALGLLADLQTAWQERGGWREVFLREGVDTPMHTMGED